MYMLEEPAFWQCWNTLESQTPNALTGVFFTLLLQHGTVCPLQFLDTLHQTIFMPLKKKPLQLNTSSVCD